MSKKNVEDVLNEGIYGKKQTKPAEQKRFLGTYRERVILALTKGQTMQDKAMAELEKAMKIHPDAKLLLNGHVSFRFMEKEKSLASKHNIPYTVVTNKKADSDLGAVLAYDHAVNNNNIFVKEEKTLNNEKVSFIDTIKKKFKKQN